MLLNRLAGRGLISVTETRPPAGKRDRDRRLEIAFLPPAALTLKDLENVWEDFAAAKFSGFSAEERARYEEFAGRTRENVRNALHQHSQTPSGA